MGSGSAVTGADGVHGMAWAHGAGGGSGAKCGGDIRGPCLKSLLPCVSIAPQCCGEAMLMQIQAITPAGAWSHNGFL